MFTTANLAVHLIHRRERLGPLAEWRFLDAATPWTPWWRNSGDGDSGPARTNPSSENSTEPQSREADACPYPSRPSARPGD